MVLVSAETPLPPLTASQQRRIKRKKKSAREAQVAASPPTNDVQAADAVDVHAGAPEHPAPVALSDTAAQPTMEVDRRDPYEAFRLATGQAATPGQFDGDVIWVWHPQPRAWQLAPLDGHEGSAELWAKSCARNNFNMPFCRARVQAMRDQGEPSESLSFFLHYDAELERLEQAGVPPRYPLDRGRGRGRRRR